MDYEGTENLYKSPEKEIIFSASNFVQLFSNEAFNKIQY